MDQRTEFVLKALSETVDFSELCREYGISRKTGYKWKNRFLADGRGGLSDASRRPKSNSCALSEDVICKIVKLKVDHPKWGPRKIRSLFARAYPEQNLPSESSFKRVLSKVGLVKPRKRRSVKDTGRITNRIKAEHPNHVWTVDFKGWWRTGDRCRFEPLTVRDAYSRYILCARALGDNRTDSVKVAFQSIMAAYGLPEIIRSDNGSPFAAKKSPLGLSRLSAWWVALGINLDRIDPGHPEQNGSHERMHRDIALELECDSEENIAAQQVKLDQWRNDYNLERPHEAIEMKVPGDLYQRSKIAYPGDEISITYPEGQIVRRVSPRGAISYENRRITVSESLAGWHIALTPDGENKLSVWFCKLRVGYVDLVAQKFYATKLDSSD